MNQEIKLELITREGCHLCDEAQDVLAGVIARFNAEHPSVSCGDPSKQRLHFFPPSCGGSFGSELLPLVRDAQAFDFVYDQWIAWFLEIEPFLPYPFLHLGAIAEYEKPKKTFLKFQHPAEYFFDNTELSS